MTVDKYILAIDHGTSGAKTAIVTVTGKVIDWEFEEVPLHLGDDGKGEQDPADWWRAILNTSRKAIDKSGVAIEKIVGISNTSQWSGTVAVGKDDEPLMNAILWMDTRGAYLMEALNKRWPRVSGYNLPLILKWIKVAGGGPTLSGKDPIAHVMYIQDQLPDIYNNTSVFLEPHDYVNLKFTGLRAASYASIQMHWITDIRDINNVVYSDQLIKHLGIDKNKFPPLKRSVDVLGPVTNEVADEIGLERGTPVVLGAPDLHAATVGSGAINNFEGHMCVGTSDWILCHVPWKKTDIFHNMASLPSAFPGRYMLINEQEIAGGALSFLRDQVLYHKDELLEEEKVPDVYKIFDSIVDSVPAGSNNLIFAPWLFGERSPVDDHAVRGGLFNLSLEMSREHIIRGIYEGVAYNTRWLLGYVEKFIGRPMHEINIIGGGAQSRQWCQIFADVMGRTIRQVKDPIQANARGAALIAAVGLGHIKEEEVAKHVEFSGIFTPRKENKPVYDKLFKEYVRIYDFSAKMARRLAKT